MDSIGTEIEAVSVDEVRGVDVILVHDSQANT